MGLARRHASLPGMFDTFRMFLYRRLLICTGEYSTRSPSPCLILPGLRFAWPIRQLVALRNYCGPSEVCLASRTKR